MNRFDLSANCNSNRGVRTPEICFGDLLARSGRIAPHVSPVFPFSRIRYDRSRRQLVVAMSICRNL